MFKFVSGLIALAAFVSFGQAHADDDYDFAEAHSVYGYADNYHCHISGSVSGTSVAIFFGGELLEGPGVITCVASATGAVTRTPVNLRIAGGGVGFDITHVENIRVYTSGIGVTRPSDFYRSFAIGASADLNIIDQGIGIDAAFRVSDDSGLGFEIGLQGRDVVGLGAHLYGTAFSIEPRRAHFHE